MASWHGIRRHHHSGRLRPHEYTSYAPLALLLVIVGLILCVCTVSAQRPGPDAKSVGLSGTMPGKPPTKGAVITSPRNGARTPTSPLTVEGTCPAGLLVEIYKNDIFAGSTMCGEDGRFKLQIDLLFGENRLIARVFDALNQPGPDSPIVTIFYDAVPEAGAPLSGISFNGTQMLLNTDAVFRGSFPGEQMAMPLTIVGGVAPFAVNVQWGDSKNNVIPRNDNMTFNATHTYTKAGVYQITVQATDSQGRVAFITVAAIINGEKAAALAPIESDKPLNKFLVLWPFYVTAVAMVISFWLGERREKHVLERAY